MNEEDNVYNYILTQEAGFDTPIEIIDGWHWGFKKHIQRSTLYKNSELMGGKLEGTTEQKPVKNIVLPILNLRYRAEDIDVKDIVLYVDNPSKYFLSFLVKKYHDDVFVIEHDLDTFFDDAKESKIDFGAGLVKDIGQAKPDVVALQTLAFCDQTDLLNGPICIKHQYTPDQLKDMEKRGWGDSANGATNTIDDVLDYAEQTKSTYKDQDVSKTPGSYIEVYELHGVLPSYYLDDSIADRFTRQMQIICYYQDKDGKKRGMTLFAKKESKSPFKAALGDKIVGRALPRGGAEELFEPQQWVNYDMIRMKDMLDAVSKVLMVTNDPTVAAKHPTGLKNMDNMEIIELAGDSRMEALNTYPRNLPLFMQSVEQWEAHAQSIGAANDSILGKQPASGTPFKLQELVAAESHGLHDYRRGKFAKWIEEVYRDWIIPYIAKQITKGAEFLSELSADEMEWLGEELAENQANRQRVEAVLNGKIPPVKEVIKQKIKEDFIRGGNKRFIKILKDEMKDAPLKVKVNVSNKQKDLSLMTDKLVNIFRFIFSTYDPNTQQFMVFQNKGMVKLFNQIIESSGFTPADFNFQSQPALPANPQRPNAEPLKELARQEKSPIPQAA
jgi:hypothetical protein